MDLDGKVALLTGGGSGLGRATSLLFAAEGARVVVADIVETTATETVEMIREAGGDAIAAVGDIALEANCKALVQAALDHYKRLDILYNGAGIDWTGPFADLTEADVTRVFGVNLFGMIYMCKHAIPALAASGAGVIVNVSSAAALSPHPYQALYAASKGAIISLTKQLAMELASRGIRVNCICQTVMETAMPLAHFAKLADPEAEIARAKAVLPFGRWGRPEEFAQAVLFLASNRSSYTSGHTLVLDGAQLAGRLTS